MMPTEKTSEIRAYSLTTEADSFTPVCWQFCSSGRIWRSYLPIYESLIHVASRENKQNSGVLGHY
jgi:hypothetical protein